MVYVGYVIDGDTVILRGGERVRYVGIDTPERGEAFYREAAERNRELVEGRVVELEVCLADPVDKYGRTLGWLRSGGVEVGEVLLREGLARTLVIPPCGLHKRREFREAEREARSRRLNIWGHAR